jgi:hypothetical protein
VIGGCGGIESSLEDENDVPRIIALSSAMVLLQPMACGGCVGALPIISGHPTDESLGSIVDDRPFRPLQIFVDA